MKNKHCKWCDHAFETNINYQIYCSAECRDAATKEKIAQRYLVTRRSNPNRKQRVCKQCGKKLSVYNDDVLCQKCLINPQDISKALRDIKGLANGKDNSAND